MRSKRLRAVLAWRLHLEVGSVQTLSVVKGGEQMIRETDGSETLIGETQEADQPTVRLDGPGFERRLFWI
jgi:hypothetical protein